MLQVHRHGVNYHMYADDIQSYLDFDPSIPCDAECCLFRLSNCIQDVQTWMLANKLMLNENKTEFFIASAPYQYKRLELLRLTKGNTTINPVSSVWNLGVTFDNSMSMSEHVTGVKQHDLNRLQRLQNKAARLIHKKPKYSHARPLLTDLHWLQVDQRINFKTALNMFKTVSNTFPSYISDTLDLSKPKSGGTSGCIIPSALYPLENALYKNGCIINQRWRRLGN